MHSLSHLANLAVSLFLAAGAVHAQSCSGQLITDPTSAKFLTGDTPFTATQADMNCYSWQMFLSLNWPVDPGWPATPAKAGEPDRTATIADFGLPGQGGQAMAGGTVWQSFMAAPEVFKAGAATPTDWGVVPPPPSSCTSANGTLGTGGSGRVLTATSKSAVHPMHRFNLGTGTLSTVSDEILEATGGWLTDQSGNLVFFERLMGKAEYDYITGKKLYDAANQMAVATNANGTTPEGLSLPKGKPAGSGVQSQEELGAFELKAAWRNLGADTELYDRYLTSTAYLVAPDGTCSETVVGLVGLHIIHKTASMPNLIWSTFEQVDNVPGNGTPPAGYSFNNPQSSDTPNVMPKCGQTCDYSKPIQVTRQVPISSGLNATNSEVQKLFATSTGGKSVFQYYQLVNVLWDGAAAPPSPEPGANAVVPLNYGTFQSEANAPVANTTMETYAQLFTPGLGPSCNACHQSATIAGSKTLASDFSFLFGTASSSQPVTGVTISREFSE
ncbi:hypothetical protein OEZ71_12965 [Defluviimonas sp. WL0050]|uniref:Cytochrome c family protein n=1 Tax=Albidovulum litorale TaxID=2984134 RepID=A0ABT2ZPY3_9RHOB|nr:hypothetical protein [Defluviimonas sp. WL0050]MCV2873206.1 hypothetical protein [Defluviimonas sp. WL0050]